jgi:hypothetical protein
MIYSRRVSAQHLFSFSICACVLLFAFRMRSKSFISDAIDFRGNKLRITRRTLPECSKALFSGAKLPLLRPGRGQSEGGFKAHDGGAARCWGGVFGSCLLSSGLPPSAASPPSRCGSATSSVAANSPRSPFLAVSRGFLGPLRGLPLPKVPMSSCALSGSVFECIVHSHLALRTQHSPGSLCRPYLPSVFRALNRCYPCVPFKRPHRRVTLKNEALDKREQTSCFLGCKYR